MAWEFHIDSVIARREDTWWAPFLQQFIQKVCFTAPQGRTLNTVSNSNNGKHGNNRQQRHCAQACSLLTSRNARRRLFTQRLSWFLTKRADSSCHFITNQGDVLGASTLLVVRMMLSLQTTSIVAFVRAFSRFGRPPKTLSRKMTGGYYDATTGGSKSHGVHEGIARKSAKLSTTTKTAYYLES